MERRGFLKALAGVVGGIAIEQAIPFGRVWSFPKNIKCLNFEYGGLPIELIRGWSPNSFAMADAFWRDNAAERLKDFAFMSGDAWQTGELGRVQTIYID